MTAAQLGDGGQHIQHRWPEPSLDGVGYSLVECNQATVGFDRKRQRSEHARGHNRDHETVATAQHRHGCLRLPRLATAPVEPSAGGSHAHDEDEEQCGVLIGPGQKCFHIHHLTIQQNGRGRNAMECMGVKRMVPALDQALCRRTAENHLHGIVGTRTHPG